MATQTNDGRGQVQDPENDGRLKDNRGSGGSGNSGGRQASGRDDDTQSGGQGRVKDPENDGRLKDNRN